ncbi:Protein export cytoplasm protein SecA2 ATPase RNA helicase [Lactococcus lactis subsp. lactis]|uniref:preprotein translocase subunit SecA n=1 Tax=Lactococcus lactis TaxID=1358 RepID=UPI00071C229D|nr:preprotein translocase subunit SecA [Lactococcus lactis]KST88009.1 Protein export cytoplasm protein SecA2 ATPase RNA helicase [Lactococcus lactis subsp. lactis]
MKLKKLLKKINQLNDEKKGLTDAQLQFQTIKLREMIEKNEQEENIVVEAFASIREADFRVLGLFPTDEQVLGGLALYYGKIAEIKTGEGKSLVATLPLYLKALCLGTVFLVTTNDYLARRDYDRVGKVYQWMGVSIADGTHPQEDEIEGHEFDFEKKKSTYASEIIYISNTTLGFDYLIDLLSESEENKFMSPLHFALLDEVDQILLDSAQQPLIISGGAKVQSNYYQVSSDFVQLLQEKQHFNMSEEKDSVWFTEEGIEKAKWYFSLPNLLDETHFLLYQHLVLALKARTLLKKDRDYMIDRGKVKLLDRRDGRILEGNKMQSGLHQSIEAKEGMTITPETQTLSSITYQNLFRRFGQLSGMSGTAKVAEDEFINTYNLKVVSIKTHKKKIRKDHRSQKYISFESKVEATLKKVCELYAHKRPILLITGSVDISELFSMYLLSLGIPHNLLNAKSSVKESLIIGEAGRLGAVTIATAMAGRGTDIKLSPAAQAVGGLAVIITERMMNQRFELQAKGRAGRQGEPGDTYSFESLEDDVIRLYMQNEIQKYYDKHRQKTSEIKNFRIKKSFGLAQKISEEKAYGQRINALKFDNVSLLQKKKFDESRSEVLALRSTSQAISLIWDNAQPIIDEFLNQGKGKLTSESLFRFILDHLDYNYQLPDNTLDALQNPRMFLKEVFEESLEKQKHRVKDEALFLQFLKRGMIKAIDFCWSAQVEGLNQLQAVVNARSSAQKRPIIEFNKEAQKSYDYQKKETSRLMLKNTALGRMQIKKGKVILTLP